MKQELTPTERCVIHGFRCFLLVGFGVLGLESSVQGFRVYVQYCKFWD